MRTLTLVTTLTLYRNHGPIGAFAGADAPMFFTAIDMELYLQAARERKTGMSSVNKVTLLGRLGADPEIRYTQSGQPVGSLRVATSENWNDRDGNRQQRTEWHNITVWGKQAETCGQYLAKGRQVYIEGRLQSREYTDRDNVQRRGWEIVASKVVFIGGRRDG